MIGRRHGRSERAFASTLAAVLADKSVTVVYAKGHKPKGWLDRFRRMGATEAQVKRVRFERALKGVRDGASGG